MSKEHASEKYAFFDRLVRDSRLAGTDYRVAWRLIDRLGQNAESWPSQGRVARELGITRETVSRSVARLARLGWFRKARGGVGNKGCSYRPCWENVTGASHLDGTETEEKPSKNVSENVTGASHKPLKEPSQEPRHYSEAKASEPNGSKLKAEKSLGHETSINGQPVQNTVCLQSKKEVDAILAGIAKAQELKRQDLEQDAEAEF